MKIGIRDKFLSCLEYLVFRLDTTRFIVDKPKLDYQPLQWVGIRKAKIRGNATWERWEQIVKYLLPQQDKTALDIGSCYGFFSIKMAEKGCRVFGIDSNPRFIRIARYAVPKRLRKQCNFIEMKLSLGNINILPSVNYILLLSVWHHWVYEFGLLEATEILTALWEKTKDMLFFESGEGEVAEEFGLPFKPDNARQWLNDYLQRTCSSSNIKIISESLVGKYKHYASIDATRALFMVSRYQ